MFSQIGNYMMPADDGMQVFCLFIAFYTALTQSQRFLSAPGIVEISIPPAASNRQAQR